MKLETTDDPVVFDAWAAEAGVDDVYFSLRWAALWAAEDRGQPLGLRGHGPTGTVLYPALRVPLDRLPGGAGRCDLRTAYDFGGPLPVAGEPAAAQAAFLAAQGALMAELGVVTEFARLHPLRITTWPADAERYADQHIVDLTLGVDAIRAAWHKTFRRNARKAEASELTAAVHTAVPPELADAFTRLYAATMDKVGAVQAYYFDPSTLRATLALPEASLVAVQDGDQVIAAAILLRSGPDLFYFLGASDADALAKRPNNLLFATAIAWAVDQGLRRLHLGAGSESLRRFKAQIGTGTAPYALLRRTWDPAAAAAIGQALGLDPAAPTFPPWRQELLR